MPKNGSQIFRNLEEIFLHKTPFLCKPTVFAHQKHLCGFAKAPLLPPENTAFTIPYTMFLETKNGAFGEQERCFYKTKVLLWFCKVRIPLKHKRLRQSSY